MEPFYGSMIIISCPIMPVKSFEQLFNMFGSGGRRGDTLLLWRLAFDHACRYISIGAFYV